jgi:predicted RNase H-like nuclease (RuvC/YqgF family)
MSDLCQAGFKLPDHGPCPHCGQDQHGVCGKLPAVQAAELTRLTTRVAELEASLKAAQDEVQRRKANFEDQVRKKRNMRALLLARAESAERERDELRREIERLRAIADAAMNIGYFTGPIEHRGDSMTISKTVAHKFAYDWNDALNALSSATLSRAQTQGRS